MKKSIVIYNSRGGNTKKVAINIAEGLGAEVVSSRKIPDLQEYDLIVLGTWIIAGQLSPGGKKYFTDLENSKVKGKKAVMFISSSAPNDPPKGGNPDDPTIKDAAFEQMENILAEKGLEIAKERLAIKGAFRIFRFGSGAFEKGHPTEEELNEAKDFGASLKKLLK